MNSSTPIGREWKGQGMEPSQSELDFLADQTLRLNESINDESFVLNQKFDEDLIEHEKLKDSFVFAPVEQQLEFSFEEPSGESRASIEEIEALCLGVLGHDIKVDQEDLSLGTDESSFIAQNNSDTIEFSFPICDLDIVVDLEEDLGEKDASQPLGKVEDEEAFVFSNSQVEVEKKLTSAIVYNTLPTETTFIVKALCLEDIEAFELTDEIVSFLKLGEGEFPEFFITDSFERAESLRSQIANKRFMVQEDSVCNIGDPGFSWWFEKTENGISIYFKSYKVNRAQEGVRLGPLGDVSTAIDKLSNFHKVFSDVIPLSEFSCDENALHLYSEIDSHEVILNLIELFENGDFFFNKGDFPKSSESIELFDYLQELSTIRQWWIEIVENL